jgi:uncharacterized phage-associated protein
MDEPSRVPSKLPVDARDVANYILDVADEWGTSISNLALQKILFFCHGNFLVHFNVALLHNPFEAWRFGPVIRSVYEAFKVFGRSPITARALHVDALDERVFVEPLVPSPQVKEFLDKVILSYAAMSPSSMVHLTHTHEGPWETALSASKTAANIGMRIDNEIIKTRFAKVGARNHPQHIGPIR